MIDKAKMKRDVKIISVRFCLVPLKMHYGSTSLLINAFCDFLQNGGIWQNKVYVTVYLQYMI
ncbi:hypothetical protein SDC9_86739 [bioreactor metagenome]|uniref:Uncharacterized protein n=1 Tax=bioreactor metagenome TaxID=1076179 RepID=A0A644ZJS4_9ZZZZ